MYTVYLDGEKLHDPRVDELQIFQKRLKLEVNTTGAFDFTIYPNHPLYNRINRLKSVIEVYQDKVMIFRGRVLDDRENIYNAKDVICEGDLAFFNDSIVRPFEYQGSITDFVKWIIDEHNKQVDESKKFQLGKVTVKTSTNYVNRSSINPLSSWEVITGRLLKNFGGFISVRRQGDTNYIDYLADSDKRSLQEIKIGQNLIDLSKETKGQEIITALIPYGAKLKDEEDENRDTEKRLTIESVNDGLDYVFDQESVDTYGWIFGTQTWDNVTEPRNLLVRAKQALAQQSALKVLVDLKAIDLSMTNEEFDKLQIFEYVKVISQKHSLDNWMLISKLDIDMENPANNKISLGVNYSSFTEKQLETSQALKDIEVIKGADGLPGKDGVGIESTSITYATSEKGDNPPEEGWTEQVPVVQPGHYLWTKITWNYTDETSETAYSKAYIGEDGNDGDNGVAGKDGVGVKDTSITYASSTSGTQAPSNGWSINVPRVETGKYLWTKTVWEYTDGTTETGFSVSHMGEDGQDGQDGAPGKDGKDGESGDDGVGITATIMQSAYGRTNEPPKTGWTDEGTYNSGQPNQIRWYRLKIVYSDGHTEYSDAWRDGEQGPQGERGQKGDQGRPGIDGRSTYMWVVFADDAEGRNLTTTFNNQPFYGVAYNKQTALPSNNPLDYTFMPTYEGLEEKLAEKASNDFVKEVETLLNSNIETESGRIMSEVERTYTEKSAFEAYQENQSTQFEQLSDSFNFNFNQLVQNINEVDGETQAVFEEWRKYIRFVDGNIILGKAGNEIVLRIMHDRIQYLQNGAEVAFFSNNKFYVTDGEFLNKLQLGNFAFIPRKNGSLDFR